MLGGMRRHGPLELLVVLPDGSKRLIPAEWTDLTHCGRRRRRPVDGRGDAGRGGVTCWRLSVLVSALSARSRG